MIDFDTALYISEAPENFTDEELDRAAVVLACAMARHQATKILFHLMQRKRK